MDDCFSQYHQMEWIETIAGQEWWNCLTCKKKYSGMKISPEEDNATQS